MMVIIYCSHTLFSFFSLARRCCSNTVPLDNKTRTLPRHARARIYPNNRQQNARDAACHGPNECAFTKPRQVVTRFRPTGDITVPSCMPQDYTGRTDMYRHDALRQDASACGGTGRYNPSIPQRLRFSQLHLLIRDLAVCFLFIIGLCWHVRRYKSGHDGATTMAPRPQTPGNFSFRSCPAPLNCPSDLAATVDKC